MPSEWWLFTVQSPGLKHSQIQVMVRYTQGTATEIQPQWDLNPIPTSISHIVAGKLLCAYQDHLATAVTDAITNH